MFFDADQIIAMRQMIMANDTEGREAALASIANATQDFESLFSIMAGRPVTIRLLDPPLHEFLPHSADELAEVAKVSGVTIETARQRAVKLSDQINAWTSGVSIGHHLPGNLPDAGAGHFEAACAIAQKTFDVPSPEMVPLAQQPRNQPLQTGNNTAATAVMAETGVSISYLVGAMVELPVRPSVPQSWLKRQNFSFGTNDMTQTALGISRDAGSFLHHYADADIYPVDPLYQLIVRELVSRRHGGKAGPINPTRH